MKKIYQNQDTYQKALYDDAKNKNCHQQPKPPQETKDFIECKLSCGCTLLNFVISDSEKSVSIKSNKNKSHC